MIICETQEDRQYRRGQQIAADYDGPPCECGTAAPIEAEFMANRYFRGWVLYCPTCLAQMDELDEVE